MSRLPGLLGQSAPPGEGDTQRQIRDLQQLVSQLVTAQQVQNMASAALRPAPINTDVNSVVLNDIDNAGVNLGICATVFLPVPAGYTQLLAFATGSVGGSAPSSGPGYVYAQMAIGKGGEASVPGNTQGSGVAALVPAGVGNSVPCFFSRLMTGLTTADTIAVVVYGGQSGAALTGGNAHLSGMAVFLR